MSEFNGFKTAVQQQFANMTALRLFSARVGKDDLWKTYLESFPAGTNEMFRERTEHDCQCCKQFIRAGGNLVTIVNNKLVSIWDIEIGGHYQVVADALAAKVKAGGIRNVFLHDVGHLGTDFNHQVLESGASLVWEHFFLNLPSTVVMSAAAIGPKLGETRSNFDVFNRGMVEISISAAETVLELIEQNSIYKGTEFKLAVESFIEYKKKFDLGGEGEHDSIQKAKEQAKKQENYCWMISAAVGTAARFRNTVIGTLLVDISDGVSLDKAVASYEAKVAPENYKRPTALITQGMIDKAQKKVAELGIENSLPRRHAVPDDLTINNVLFADRSVKPAMGVFDELKQSVPDSVKNLDKVDEVSIDVFLADILPKAEGLELMFDNKNINNLMSLIAPQDAGAPPILKWPNNFSWAYNGEVTDSIKEKVKKAGGNVSGALRCSLSWFNRDDLDIHVIEPTGRHIFYSNKRSPSSGQLDVDMNVNGGDASREAVENIVWTDKEMMPEGIYEVYINNYCRRESLDMGFDAEIEFDDVTHSFHFGGAVGKKVLVAKFEFSRKNGIKILESLPSTQASKEVWGVATSKFHKVTMVMNSPNHWDGNQTGNKHVFFTLEGCRNPEKSRGLFNEFLRNDLQEHRKVFEVLGSKLRVEESDVQLSGLGFSSTVRNQIVCKVTGSFSRIIKINF